MGRAAPKTPKHIVADILSHGVGLLGVAGFFFVLWLFKLVFVFIGHLVNNKLTNDLDAFFIGLLGCGVVTILAIMIFSLICAPTSAIAEEVYPKIFRWLSERWDDSMKPKRSSIVKIKKKEKRDQ